MLANDKKFVPVMITPFRPGMTIDYTALGKLIDFYLAAGVKGLFANCLSSEMFSITDEERLQLTRFVVDHVNGKVPVVATGSFGSTLYDKAEFVKKIYDTGVNAVILITSHFALPTDESSAMLSNFSQLLEATGNIPLGMYECPAPYKRILSADEFRTLVDTNRFIYHKDTCLRVDQIKAKLEAIKENKVLEFYDAHTPNALHSLRSGARGMSSISGNFYPEIMAWMVAHADDAAKQTDAEWLQAELNSVDPLIHNAYPLSAKYFLHKRGMNIDLSSRVYVHSLTADQQHTLDEIYDRFTRWAERLSIPVTKF